MGDARHGQRLDRSGIGRPDDVMNHHTAVAVAGFWTCYRCLRELGRVGLGMPVTAADCTPRRWGDGAP